MGGAGGVSGAVATRPKTLLEMQPYMFAYGFGISLFSPMASLYQLAKLNPQVQMSGGAMARMSARILPHQTVLKMAQMTACTPVKENLNPWAAFAVVGVLQGGVYGQANIFFAKALKLGTNPSYQGMLRGVAFAAARDTISQGVPFVFSGAVRSSVLDPLLPTESGAEGGLLDKTKQWASVLGCSVFATFASQGLHNCQITMQANSDLGYAGTVQKVFAENGIRTLWRGAEARVSLLLIVNIFNELLLKPAWEEVPVEE